MKTLLQEVFAQLRASKESDSFGVGYCVDWLLENEKSLVEKEKEVMSKVYADGGDWDEVPQPRFENYYNITFNTKER